MASHLSQAVGIPVADNLGVYLGIPLLYKPVSKWTFVFLVDKVKKKFLEG